MDSTEEETRIEILSSRSPSPEAAATIPPVCVEIDIIVSGRSLNALDRRILDLNLSYDDFVDRLDNIIAQKRKLSLDVVQSSRQPLRYYWIRQTQAAGNPRNLGKPSLVEDEENYKGLLSTISKTAKAKLQLDNMVLRVMFELNLDGNVAVELRLFMYSKGTDRVW